MISKIPGPLTASASSILGWYEGTPSTQFPQSALRQLAIPLHFEGGETRPQREGVVMDGEYQVTWDLSEFTLPPVNAHQDYRVVPYVYVSTRSDVRRWTYDPVPSNQTQGRVRLYRADGSYFIPSVSYAGNVTTFVIGFPFPILRVLGVPISQRWYWSMCETYP